MIGGNKRPLILIAGVSGAGKDTLVDYMCNQFGYKKVKSYTTRPPRYKGEDTHIFITQKEMDNISDRVAYFNRNGIEYCATYKQVKDADFYIVDPKGIDYFLTFCDIKRQVIVIKLECDAETCEERIRNRSNQGVQEVMDRQDERLQFNADMNECENNHYGSALFYALDSSMKVESLAKMLMRLVQLACEDIAIPLTYSNMVYVSHPFHGINLKQDTIQNNVQDIEKHILKWQKEYYDKVFVSPVHCFGFLYDHMQYEDGLDWCMQLLSKCNEMWVCGDYQNSKGCLAEIEYCKNHYIPYYFKED